MIVAIDGPAAAGKGTLARRLAAELGLPYLDTGLLYRAVGRRVLEPGRTRPTPAAAEAQARALRPDDLARADLRGPAADRAASLVAAVPGVRAALLAFQRGFAGRAAAVLDGRDIGTVIFPDADVKLFVTASLAARAERRWQELAARVRPHAAARRGGHAGARRVGRGAGGGAAAAGGRCGGARHHLDDRGRGIQAAIVAIRGVQAGPASSSKDAM